MVIHAVDRECVALVEVSAVVAIIYHRVYFVFIVTTIAFGIGYELDPKLIVLLTSSESALWIVMESIIDIFKT